jgi:hypothetical protein
VEVVHKIAKPQAAFSAHQQLQHNQPHLVDSLVSLKLHRLKLLHRQPNLEAFSVQQHQRRHSPLKLAVGCLVG